MFKLIKRMWNYLVTGGRVKFDEKADPTIQLEQAIVEANGQHNRLVDQGANVIAIAKKTERDLDDARAKLAKAQDNAKSALLLQDQATKSGNAAQAEKFGLTAQSFATQLVGLEERVHVLESQLLEATKGADNAKAMVRNNGLALQQKLSEKNELLSTLEQAKNRERFNAAQKALTSTIGEDVPSFDEIRNKINQRAAKADAVGELAGQSVEAGMLEVEAASMDNTANERLKVMRIQLGLEAPEAIPALGSAEDAIVDATIIPDSPEAVQTPVTGQRGGGASGGA